MAPRTRIRLVWTAAIVTAFLLASAALGLSSDFYDLRFGIAIGFLALAGLGLLLQYPRLGIAALALGALFSPFFPLRLHRYTWTILDTLAIAGVLYFAHWATNPYKKGSRFEDYVASLFPEPDFIIQDRTRDISKHLERRVESDSNPDFIFRERKTGRVFAVECKYSSIWKQGRSGDVGLWWDTAQAARYRAFERETGIPVYVAFGIGGHPGKPKEVYRLELSRLQSPFLTQSLIRSSLLFLIINIVQFYLGHTCYLYSLRQEPHSHQCREPMPLNYAHCKAELCTKSYL